MFDPSLFLKQANQWVENKDQESFRSAASRAYYSLFNETLEYLKTNHSKDLIEGIRKENFDSPNPKFIEPTLLKALDRKYLGKIVNMHSVVPNVCLRLGGKTFSSIFRTKHENRKEADYDMNLTFYYDDVKKMISDIEALIRQIRQKKLR